MLTRAGLVLVLVLLPWSRSWMRTRAQLLDYDSWTDDHASLSDGLCRYGNGVECCWGWTRTDDGRCRPQCQQGCKHGVCVAPDRCRCHPGYTGKTCNQDLNECGLKPRPCKHRCMNTVGSYKCYCQDGYTLQEDGSCRNARTCYHANCQYGCEVMKGAVQCTCPSPGLRLGPDRRTCVDVDECAFGGGGVCPRHRKCVNTFGSFVCRCHFGFKLMFMNGRYICADKDPRPFCSLNPSSPKCKCKGNSCKAVPKVTVEPQTLKTTTTTTAITSPMTTTTIKTATTSPAPATTPTTTTPEPTTTTTTTPTTTTTTPTTTTPKTTTSTTTPTTTTTTTTTPTTTTTTTTTPTTTTPKTTSTTTPTTTTPKTTTTTTTPTTTKPTTTTTKPTSTTPELTTTTTKPTLTTTKPTITMTTPATTTTAATTTPTTSTTVSLTTTTPVVTTMLTTPTTTTQSNRIDKNVTNKQRGDVHIPRHHNQVWEFDIELGNIGEDDARDDPNAGMLRCTFDHGVCDWLSDRDGDLHWETSPNPAGGRFLSVPELKAGQRSVRGARLAVQITPPWSHSDLCFSFSHWLTRRQVGVLQLFVRKMAGRERRYGYSPAHWSRTGGHGWRRTQVTMTTGSVDQVMLKAERRHGRRGLIAVDDITLRRGAC